MKKQFQKDKKLRKLFNQKELDNFLLKNIIRNSNLSLIIKWNAIIKLSNFCKYSNRTRFVNRCILTSGKAKYNQIFKTFSRLSFLKLARSGVINGLQKSSW